MKVLVEKDGPVTTVIINRPEARNAVDPETAAALREAFRAFEKDGDALAAVLCGAGAAGGWAHPGGPKGRGAGRGPEARPRDRALPAALPPGRPDVGPPPVGLRPGGGAAIRAPRRGTARPR